jgi:hypothetical protein
MDINEAVEIYNDLLHLEQNGIWPHGAYPLWIHKHYKLLLDMEVGASQIHNAAISDVARVFHQILVNHGIVKPRE